MFFKNIFIKKKCINCGRFSEKRLCTACLNQFQSLPFPYCKICKSNNISDNNCRECLIRKPLFKELITLGVYNGLLKTLIYNYKYENFKNYSQIFGYFLSEEIKNHINLKSIDYITCIPLHSEKLKSRGFNQAELIAKEIYKNTGIPYIDLLTRVKNTTPQFSLTNEERNSNLKNAFEINSKINFTDKSIIIIDDIFTTGATIQEACRILKENNVKDIYVSVLARSLN